MRGRRSGRATGQRGVPEVPLPTPVLCLVEAEVQEDIQSSPHPCPRPSSPDAKSVEIIQPRVSKS